jgi:UDP-N-acetylmuramate: L-alanyl-gamma-D-glutamyl-meso-diaminopimelate ligase
MISSRENAGKKLPTLHQLQRVHVIGVCGTLMGAFAAFLKRRGIEVTGSDQNVYPPMSDVLTQAGIRLFAGYDPKNLTGLPQPPDLVVIGNVIPGTNPEARAAIDGGYAYSSLPEAMERLMLMDTRNIVVAGTHGKTTTSCLMSHVLASCGKDPSYFFGGVAHDLPFSFNVPSVASGHPFVLEGDEYDTAFWDKVPKFTHYLPDDVILTSVEYDHADIYPDFASVVRAFEGLMDRIRPQGRLIACFDFAVIRELSRRAQVPVLSYGLDPSARFRPARVRSEAGITRFDVTDGGQVVDEIALNLPGNHNVTNALAVWIECRELGLDPQAVRQAMLSFRGVKRRQEVRGEVGGVIVMDDFAHHPTAVRETLKALKMKYPDRRLIAVFEPRSATSRRKVFQQEFAQAFHEAELVYIAKPYDQSKIPEADQFSSDQLVDDISRLGSPAVTFETVEAGVRQVSIDTRPGDLVAVMSNGGFEGFIPKLLEVLKRRTSAA